MVSFVTHAPSQSLSVASVVELLMESISYLTMVEWSIRLAHRPNLFVFPLITLLCAIGPSNTVAPRDYILSLCSVVDADKHCY
jgi:TctA family transporter